MYNQIAEEMVDAKVATPFETPKWMDKAGNVVKEEEAFGCKVTHDITNPDYCLMMDEVDGNINQERNGNMDGQLQLLTRHYTTTKDYHKVYLSATGGCV